ncbi:hypothetical protein HOLleu_16213 [Holothuria leucospilota]|uniref:Uncharacterized protein n=1 Tax=Holothuria leucospilota TaxID=206669 RepID=A0A9Q1HAS1_HOLLE|nr:hypothetical protein HOLleu_16213 [Holothuria leucospilota]
MSGALLEYYSWILSDILRDLEPTVSKFIKNDLTEVFKNLQKSHLFHIAEDADDDSADSSKKFTGKSVGEKSASSETCFFCDKPAPDGKSVTRKASTFGLDINVRKAAMKLQDKSVLAKLSAGDLIAQEARYHLPYLLSLYNRARDKKQEDSGVDKMSHGLALAELVSYIEDTRMDSLVAPIFKLSNQVDLMLDQH